MPKYREESWLRERYIDERKSTREIAEEADVSAPTIQKWLKKNDIPIRHGSEAIKTQWEGNTERKQRQAEHMKDIRQPWWEMDDGTRERVKSRLSEWWSENNPMEGRTGEENPAWNGGKEYYYGPNWAEQASKARERDNHKCVVCGAEKDEGKPALHVHHIRRIGWFKDEYDSPEWYQKGNDLGNLVTLCGSCHPEWEGIPVRPDTR